ncbi:MAG TPA: hypothetical protein VJ692_01250 [Nitrospiraceae bacterium]|nr:hypothetical protein [Nitrospiraceae bacterium]
MLHAGLLLLAVLFGVSVTLTGNGIAVAQQSSGGQNSLSAAPTSRESTTSLTDTFSLSSGLSTNLFRQPPVITGRYSLHGQTIMPYLGAGFNAGGTTDTNSTIFQDRLFRESPGHSMMPNEFQMGLRIPF